MRQVIGALCTYHRPDDLRESLDVLDRQSRPLDRLVIVDNGQDPDTAAIVAGHPLGARVEIELLEPAGNLGPAGGYSVAFERVLDRAGDDDVFLLLDDDDPPPTDSAVADVVAQAERLFDDPDIAGVGLRGGRLDLRTGIIESRPSTTVPEIQSADHLHGGWLPAYRVGALRSADAFDSGFFWGFDDLELGRRLGRAGYAIRVVADIAEGGTRRRPHGSTMRLAARSWRHYYRHRNLLRVLRRDRAWSAIALTIGIRLIAKPLANLVIEPRLGLWHLRTNTEAIVDGLVRTDRVTHPRHRPPEPEVTTR